MSKLVRRIQYLVFSYSIRRQLQNKIDLTEVLWARETEQTPQTLVFTKTAGHKTSPGSLLYCHNPIRHFRNEKEIGPS